MKAKLTIVFVVIIPSPEKGNTYSDQTDRFPYQSSQGNKYVLILYNYDTNAILQHPLKDRTASQITFAWKHTQDRLTGNGHRYNLHLLDDEISAEFKASLEDKNIAYQLSPQGNHRMNAAERSIRTFKNHFSAGLASCHPDFPIREWDRLLDQAELTFDSLRNSRFNQSSSAWTYLFGNHDFNRVPLVPPGTKFLIHSKPNERASCKYHGKEGYYVGPAKQHYRCITCWMNK